MMEAEPRGGLAEFSGEANGAIVDCIGHRQQGRQVTSMSMQLRQTAEVDVPKMLTPEHCESRSNRLPTRRSQNTEENSG